MKIRINISISEEAVNTLNQQPNKSQYIEDLILNKQSEDSSAILNKLNELERNLKYIEKPKVEGSASASASFTPKLPDPETGYPCCTKKAPCKHWNWTGENYTNILTGEIREVNELQD